MRLLLSLLLFSLFSFSATAQQTPPDDFGTLPQIYDAALSPDGTQIAIFITVEGTYAVRVMHVKGDQGEAPRAFLLGDGVKPRWIKWANNNQVLAAMWQNEIIQRTPITASYIYTVDASTMEHKILVRPSRKILRQNNSHVIDFLEDDPDHILMAYSNIDQGRPAVQRVNIKTRRAKTIKSGSSRTQYWYTDQRGEPRIGQGLDDGYEKVEKWHMTIRDANSDKWRNSSEYPGLEPDTDVIGFTSNPNEVIIRSRNGRDTLGLYTYNLDDKKMGRALFHDDDYDASSVVLSADGNEVIGAKLVTDTREIRMFEGKTTVLDRMRSKYPNSNIDYIDQSYDKRFVLFKLSSPTYPGVLMMVDSNTDKVTIYGKYYPQLEEEELGLVQQIKYSARDGFRVPAYITLPPKAEAAGQVKNLPYIILPHGGPYARSSKRFDYFAQFFASQGYGVMQMNFRGSAGYGEAYEDAGRESWVLMQDDVEDGARFLIEKGYADPNKMCIAGWSFGGYISLMAAVKNSDIYQCSISMAGVTDIPDLIRDAKKYRFGALSANTSIISGFTDNKEMKENSPARRADEITMPVFIAHGKKDQRVHFDQYKRMVRALKKSSSDVTTMEFVGEDHFLSEEGNRKRFFNGLETFLIDVNGKSEWAND